MGNSWKDFSDKSLQNKLLDKVDGFEGMAVDNFAIKGFAVQKQDLNMYLTLDNSLEPTMPGAEETPVNALLTFEGTADAVAPENIKIDWILSKAAKKLFILNDGRTPNRKIIYAKKSGRTAITVNVDGIGTLIYPIKITVPRSSVESIKTEKKALKVKVENLKYTGITHYELAYRQKGSKKWKTRSFSSASSVLKLTGLKKGKRYQVKARAWTTDEYGKFYGSYSFSATSGKVA